MSNTSVERSHRDRIRQAAALRRKLDRTVAVTAERIARDYEEGRGATACMADLLAALGHERKAVREKPPVVLTATMRRDLETIQRCGYAGAAQSPGSVWRGPGGTVQDADVLALTSADLVRRNYDWRAPRLVLTAAGRRLLAEARK